MPSSTDVFWKEIVEAFSRQEQCLADLIPESINPTATRFSFGGMDGQRARSGDGVTSPVLQLRLVSISMTGLNWVAARSYQSDTFM
ncbi:MAG: hypothetical protein ACRBM6_35005 [Geminicoccales bacterium]